MRDGILGAYKGLIYFLGLDTAREVYGDIEELVKSEVSKNIEISIKRGCTEFSQAFPDYAVIDDNTGAIMEYLSEWEKYEALADESGLAKHLKPVNLDSYDQQDFSLWDARVMLNWLKYAATIGDESYKKITDIPVVKVDMVHPRPTYIAE